MSDNVNHPDHYTGFSNDSEPIDILENLVGNGSHSAGYVIRATRADGRKKLDPIEDLEKSIWYNKREIARLRSLGVKKLSEMNDMEFFDTMREFYDRPNATSTTTDETF